VRACDTGLLNFNTDTSGMGMAKVEPEVISTTGVTDSSLIDLSDLAVGIVGVALLLLLMLFAIFFLSRRGELIYPGLNELAVGHICCILSTR